MGLSEGEDKEKGTEKIFKEIMAEDFLNVMKEMNLSTPIAYSKTASKMNSKRPTLRHIIIRLSKARDRILKVAGKANHHVQRILNKIISRFVIRNLEARR